MNSRVNGRARIVTLFSNATSFAPVFVGFELCFRWNTTVYGVNAFLNKFLESQWIDVAMHLNGKDQILHNTIYFMTSAATAQSWF